MDLKKLLEQAIVGLDKELARDTPELKKTTVNCEIEIIRMEAIRTSYRAALNELTGSESAALRSWARKGEPEMVYRVHYVDGTDELVSVPVRYPDRAGVAMGKRVMKQKTVETVVCQKTGEVIYRRKRAVLLVYMNGAQEVVYVSSETLDVIWEAIDQRRYKGLVVKHVIDNDTGKVLATRYSVSASLDYEVLASSEAEAQERAQNAVRGEAIYL